MDLDYDKSMEPKYELENPCFKAIVNAIIMTTEAFFDFKPSIDDIRKALAEEEGRDIKQYPKEFNKVELPELAEKYEFTEQRLLEEHEGKPFIEKKLVGDPDEEGLVRFCQPLTVDSALGYYKTGTLQELRSD